MRLNRRCVVLPLADSHNAAEFVAPGVLGSIVTPAIYTPCQRRLRHRGSGERTGGL